MNRMMEKAMEQYREAIIKDLTALTAIPSVGAESAGPGRPFGDPVARALEFMLRRGRELGFRTVNYDGYAGSIEYGEEGPVVALLCHLDVVPPGDGWSGDPFTPRLEEGKLIARGASDNKGPAAAALHTLDAFRQGHPEPPFRLRLLLGTDEERSMSGIDYYLQKEGLPDYAIAPDAEYPLVSREKGIVDLKISSRPGAPGTAGGSSIVESINAGVAYNVVPDAASALILQGAEEFVEAGMSRLLADYPHLGKDGDSALPLPALRREDGRLWLDARGRTAHAGVPHKGDNAILRLLWSLSQLQKKEPADGPAEQLPADQLAAEQLPADTMLSSLFTFFGAGTDGNGLGIATPAQEGDSAGGLTISLGLLRYSGDEVFAGVNLRYPVGCDFAPLHARMKTELNRAGFRLDEKIHLPPHHVPEDSILVRSLRRAYEEITGLDGTPRSMAGGTYARKITARGVAFGANFPGTDTRAHQSDEFIIIDDLIRHSDILLRGLELLGREIGSL